MLDNETKTLIHIFNQYGKIPLALNVHYVNTVLNQVRMRVKCNHLPKVLMVDTGGRTGVAVRNEVGGFIHLASI